MSAKCYTIKELADELGVTKPGIRKLMTDSFRKQYTKVTSNRILINSSGAKIIRKHFVNSKAQTNQKQFSKTKNGFQKQEEALSDDRQSAVITAKDETIRLLKDQLKAKDDQLANMQKLMDQNQQLLLHTQEENKHLLALSVPKKETRKYPIHNAEYRKSEQVATKDETSEVEGKLKMASKGKNHWWKFW